MFSKRTITTSVLVAAMSLGAGAAVLTSPVDAVAEGKKKPCVGKNTASFPGLKAACDKGGFKEARKYMKGIEKKLKKKGEKFKCKDCHTDTKTYPNKPNAVEDLKKVMAKLK